MWPYHTVHQTVLGTIPKTAALKSWSILVSIATPIFTPSTRLYCSCYIDADVINCISLPVL